MWVSKPIFGREGAGVFISRNFTNYDNFQLTTETNFGVDRSTNERMGHSIYQQYYPLPVVQDRVVQTSVWVIHGMPAAINFREDLKGTNLEDGSPFLLHTVRGGEPNQFDYKLTQNQADIRRRLYGENHCDEAVYEGQSGAGA